MSRRPRQWMLLVACCCAAAPASMAMFAQEAGAPKDIAWRSDYNQAVVEAEKRGLPIFIEFTSNDCYWCRKLEESTLRDPRVAAVLQQNYVSLKINVSRDPKLANELRVDRYPTLVIAGPGRKIIYMKEGFQEADPFLEVLQRSVPQVVTPDWMKQHFELALKAYQDGDYGRAYASLRSILEDGKGRAIHADAQKMFGAIEAKANERLARAKNLAAEGKAGEAVQALTETLVTFPGMTAAKEAGEMLNKLALSSEQRTQQRTRRAGELLGQAREFYKTKDIVPCLDRCEILLASYGDLPEGVEASQIVQEIRANQDWLQLAADTLGDRLAGVLLAMADNLTKRGQPREAEVHLRRLIQAFPGSRHAEAAQTRMGQLQGIPASRVNVGGGPE